MCLACERTASLVDALSARVRGCIERGAMAVVFGRET
jgi:hypothetical protein